MRIVHTADIHIGVETYGRPATRADVDALPAAFAPGVDRSVYLGLSTRLLDFLYAFDQVVAYAVERRADLFLIAGDAYKSRDPSQTHQREFARRLATLLRAGIPVFLLTGNHDIAHSPTRATALDIFPTLDVSGITVAERFGVHRVETPSGPLQVVALPWIRRGALLARDDVLGLPIDSVTGVIEEDLSARLQQAAGQLDPALPAILTAHVTVNGSVTSSERSMMLGRDYALMPSALALPAFDYVALGHIHRHQRLSDAPPMVYPGSPQRVDFSEERDAKGFCAVEIDPAEPAGQRARWEHVPIDARRFLTIEVTVPPEAQDPTAWIVERIAQHDAVGAVVRVRVTVPAALAPRISERAVRDALSAAHTVAGVSRDVVQSRTPRIGSDAHAITPQQALERYLQGRADLDDATRSQALALGHELVGDEPPVE